MTQSQSVLLSVLVLLPVAAGAQTPAPARVEVRVFVRHEGESVAGAVVTSGAASQTTDRAGRVVLQLPLGPQVIVVSRDGFLPATVTATVSVGLVEAILVDLVAAPDVDEEVIVVASTRSGKRLEDQPLRVEVVPGEEVQEKIMMAPGDISMLLAETNGLRVQTSSPSLGGANVRIQGLRGRYSQVLSDGLPLFGTQTGSIGLLQIPPMDLGQVEIIKGVASALYGMSAVGGVINLVSRRPPETGLERELLVNTTSHSGADIVNWQAGTLSDTWKWSFLGGAHVQARSDLDADGWTDLPSFRRVVARPRLYWDTEGGRSALITVGFTGETRDGGTMPGRAAPDGLPFAEGVRSRRLDAGFVTRALTRGGRIVAARASLTSQRQDRTIGRLQERDRHVVSFGEVTLMGATGPHTWVAGVAATFDRYRSADVPRFDYSYGVPALFIQDDVRLSNAVVVSGSARLDVHSAFGAFLSPKVSVLVRPKEDWSVRLSGGRGYFAPTAFTEESEAIGLSSVAPLDSLDAERATTSTADISWTPGRFELTLTGFRSTVRGALTLIPAAQGVYAFRIAPLMGPVSTHGTEFIARFHREGFDIVATHMWLRSTEPTLSGGGRERTPLNPGHSASFDMLRQVGPVRIGFEVFFTGKQALDENPFREEGRAHTLVGGLIDWAVGPGRLFVNVENLRDTRQTKFDPLVRPARGPDGRWTVDGWAPLDGRTANVGFRWKF